MSNYRIKAQKWNAFRSGLARIPEHHITWRGTVDDTVLATMKAMSKNERIPPQIKMHEDANDNEIIIGGWWHKSTLPTLVHATLNMFKGVPKWLIRLEQVAPSKYINETEHRRYQCNFDFTEDTAGDAKYLHMHDVFLRTVCALAIRPEGEEYMDSGEWASIFGVMLGSVAAPFNLENQAPFEVYETHSAYCGDWVRYGFRDTSKSNRHKDMNPMHWRGSTDSPKCRPLFYRQQHDIDFFPNDDWGDGEYTVPKDILDKWFDDAMDSNIKTTDDAKVQTHRYIPLKDDTRKPVPVSVNTRGHITPIGTAKPATYWVDPVSCTNCGQRLIMYLSKAQSPESGPRPDLTVNCPDCLTDFTPYP